MAKYNEIIPEGADRIMKQAEAQSAHRIEIEKKVVSDQGARESNGQWFGFIIALVGIGCGTYIIISGHAVAGCTVFGGPLVGIVSVFVYSKAQGATERRQKRDQMDEVDPELKPQSEPNKNPSKNQQRKKRRH